MKKTGAIVISFLIAFNSFIGFAQNHSTEDITPLLSELNIMVGDTNGDLYLDKLVSRAEFTKVAVASSSYRNSVATNLKTSSYKDVPSSHWAAPYIKVGVDNGFCKGYTDATFRPDNTVTYEEAVTMLLRVLGYTDDDFGNSWPYGQIGLAENFGISDGVNASVGEELTRNKVAILVYNTLNTKMKDSSQRLISIFDTQKIEDAILISMKNNTSKNEVYTSEGTFKFNAQLDSNDIGKNGDLYIKDSNELIAFVPYAKTNTPEKHIVYSMLDNSVITYNNNKMNTLTIPSNTTLYDDDVKTTYSSKSSQIEMGDILYVQKNSNNDYDYVIYEEGNVEGPFTVTSSFDTQKYSNSKVLRNGEASTSDQIQTNDILYYISDLDMVLSYSTKITGVYESASPNKDAPTSITVSGVSYNVESGTAFEKLSSSGSFKYGDTVTLLLGKTNDVADVLSPNGSGAVYGYLYETGKKEYTNNDLSKYTSYYIKVVTPDGQTNEYIADKDYDNYKNSVKKITFESGVAKASNLNAEFDVSGTFDWTDKKLGTAQLATDVKIIDVSTTDANYNGTYVTVFPGRLDGVKISSNSVLYAGKNDKNQIDHLVLENVTGDTYTYGLITSAKNNSTSMSASGSYTYDIGGASKSFNSSGISYGVSSGQAAKFTFTAMGSVQSMQAINEISANITDISYSSLTAGNKNYPISDRVVVYKRDYNYNYTIIPLSEIIDNDEYSLTAYYDKSAEAGGRVRIIIAKQ